MHRAYQFKVRFDCAIVIKTTFTCIKALELIRWYFKDNKLNCTLQTLVTHTSLAVFIKKTKCLSVHIASTYTFVILLFRDIRLAFFIWSTEKGNWGFEKSVNERTLSAWCRQSSNISTGRGSHSMDNVFNCGQEIIRLYDQHILSNYLWQ
jgi:hypothetical protein